ncbi:mammalian cell entry protein [Mycobacterium mantenii]|uniref:Mammalian cell entry protein n=1 Tax=Mycobacterium mantenii TaxID=560555 RepID=A0A1X0FM30_MYCNT|nr:mammalian cell entry protein [Mycobacterium mantenii]
MNVNALPQPGASYRGGYDIVIEFDNVLNLPERAKVVMDGTAVGIVTQVALKSHEVDVTARIAPSVVVPSNIHAVLQQATVLGDMYVALERPQTDHPEATPALAHGARIPLVRTKSSQQLEDTIANLATFVSSGSIQRIQNTIIGINRITPHDLGAVQKVASQVSADLTDLSDNMNLVDQWFNGVSGTVDVMHSRLDALHYLVTNQGMMAFDHFITLMGYIGKLLPSVGSIYSGGYWLMPLLYSLRDAMGALQHSKWAFEREWPAWRQLFTRFFLPEDKYPAINITSIIGPDGREMSGNVQDVLRILGAAP